MNGATLGNSPVSIGDAPGVSPEFRLVSPDGLVLVPSVLPVVVAPTVGTVGSVGVIDGKPVPALGTVDGNPLPVVGVVLGVVTGTAGVTGAGVVAGTPDESAGRLNEPVKAGSENAGMLAIEASKLATIALIDATNDEI